MSQSIDLLSRLQAATEGSAELDRDVLIACGWKYRLVDEMLVTEYRWFDAAGHEHVGALPRPTRSLDDITRMIDAEGMEWQSGIMSAFVGETLGDNDGRHFSASHPDRCLALCLAFLRARATP